MQNPRPVDSTETYGGMELLHFLPLAIHKHEGFMGLMSGSSVYKNLLETCWLGRTIVSCHKSEEFSLHVIHRVKSLACSHAALQP